MEKCRTGATRAARMFKNTEMMIGYLKEYLNDKSLG